jgi:cobalt-zinc-cadmium efflux system outer membrane protein
MQNRLAKEPALARRKTWLLALFAGGLALTAAGCACPPVFHADGFLGAELADRTCHAPVSGVCPGEFVLPPDVVLEDGLSEDESIATALTNNAAFRATLAQLAMAQGDFVQAGLLANPNLITMIPVGVKQWEWTLYFPIETFVVRPHRLAVAESERQRVANQLVQNGLTLVRDVRVAHADWTLAQDRAALAREGASLRQQIAGLTEKRLQRGDISELEAMTARVDALTAQANATLLEQNVAIARGRLANLMGLPPEFELFHPATQSSHSLPPQTSFLLEHALASRPDLQAAEWAVAAAARRVEVARWQFLRVDVGADGNSRGEKGSEAGPALRLDLPIFNRNEGGVLRAQAELEQAAHNRDAVRNQIVQEVRTAAAQMFQSAENLEILQNRVAPSLQEAVALAQNAYEGGGASYLLVLQTTTQYLDARGRILDQTAAWRRALAELERGVGRRLDGCARPGIVSEEIPAPPPGTPSGSNTSELPQPPPENFPDRGLRPSFDP